MLEPARQREVAHILYQQAAHMTRLINELLDLARMEARGSRAFEMHDISLSDLVQEVIAGFMVPTGRSPARLIEHHGGEVMLTSHPGSGTSVMATLLIRQRS